MHLPMALLNCIFCLGIAWAGICRLNTPYARFVKLLRVRYTVMLTGALTCGFQPILFNEIPGAGTTALSFTVFLTTCLSLKYWSQQEV